MEWTVKVPEKYQDLLRKVGVDTSSCDDDVHDALVGLFARLSTLDGTLPTLGTCSIQSASRHAASSKTSWLMGCHGERTAALVPRLSLLPAE